MTVRNLFLLLPVLISFRLGDRDDLDDEHGATVIIHEGGASRAPLVDVMDHCPGWGVALPLREVAAIAQLSRRPDLAGDAKLVDLAVEPVVGRAGI